MRRYLPAILLLYVLLGVSYALATPPLESSDEYKHYPVVQYIQTEGRLPILDAANPGRWQQEGAQAPLYYILMAVATSWIDTRDLPDIYHVNPHAYIGDPNQIANKNIMLHDPSQESFPWQGSILAVYVIRFLSIGLGLLTITLTAQLGRLLFSSQAGLLAAALTAFNPMFLFISAAVNNDSLAALLGAAGIYLLVCIWQDPHWSWRFPALGLVLGLGVLTKLSLGALAGLVAVALVWRAWQSSDRRLLYHLALSAAIALLLSGWWFWRNHQLYGDITALNVFIAVQGTRAHPIALADWQGEFGTFYRSYWGLFGGVNVAAPQWFYAVCNGLAVIGTVGLVIAGRPARHAFWGSGRWLLAAWTLVVFALLLRWTVYAPSFQGRLLFPALASLNVLWAVGLCRLWPSRPQWAAAGGALAVAWLLVAAALLPWHTIKPAYAFPQPLAEVPASARYGPISFITPNGEIQLVGVEMSPDQTVYPGENKPIELVLYWQAVRPVRTDYVTAVHLLGRDLASVGQVDRYPAWGMIPTSRWQPGQIWRDPYHVYVVANAAAPARLQVSVSLYSTARADAITAFAPDGAEIPLLLLGEPVRLRAVHREKTPAVSLDVPFAGNIRLRGYTITPASAGAPMPITLFWEATGTPTQDYTVFVHLLSPGGQLLQVADAPPVANNYPTSFWRSGDWIDDQHLMPLPADLPPGDYTIAVGLYLPETEELLPRLDDPAGSVSWPVTIR